MSADSLTPPASLRWYQRSPGRVLSGTVCVVAAWLLWWCSVPAFSFRIITVGLLLIVLGAVWGIRMLVFLHARPDGMPRGRQAWVVPGVVVACLLLSVSGAGFQFRWALSRPAFDAAVRSGHPVEGQARYSAPGGGTANVAIAVD